MRRSGSGLPKRRRSTFDWTIGLRQRNRAGMAVKPLYGVGLDAGSRRTRMVICGLEGRRLRLLGCGSVPSHGWKKGRIADQTAVADSIRGALREAEAAAGVSAEAAVVGVGGYTVRGANG